MPVPDPKTSTATAPLTEAARQQDQRYLLGAFLRARRGAIQPEAPYETPTRRRRTPGLRREELAARAGIGVTWVAWLEQGRAARASAETLGRLADALRLSAPERLYLFRLAGRADPRGAQTGPSEEAPASLRALVEALPWPAYGLDPAWNVCCANDGARALFDGLFAGDAAPNLLHYVFTHNAARMLLPDWEERAGRLLAEFRKDYSRTLADPRVRAVVDHLMEASATFRTLWQQQAVAGREGGVRVFVHPQGGLIRYAQHTLSAAERPDFKLVALEPI